MLAGMSDGLMGQQQPGKWEGDLLDRLADRDMGRDMGFIDTCRRARHACIQLRMHVVAPGKLVLSLCQECPD